MPENVIRTGVDELLDLLKGIPKIPLVDAAKMLKVPIDVLQAWVDFLVEERIVGIEYKFTTAYIYLNNPVDTPAPAKKEDVVIDISDFKKDFWERAKANNIPQDKIPDLWRNHLVQELEIKKKYFFFEAQQRGIVNIDTIWSEYRNNILSV